MNKQERNRLPQDKHYQLSGWLAQQREYLINERPQRPEVAEMATKALGFEVTTANIVGAIKVTGIKWVAKSKPKPVEEPKLTYTGTDGDIVILARVLADHIESLGSVPPNSILRMAGRLL